MATPLRPAVIEGARCLAERYPPDEAVANRVTISVIDATQDVRKDNAFGGTLNRELAQVTAAPVGRGGNALNAVHQRVYIERLGDYGLNQARGVKTPRSIIAC